MVLDHQFSPEAVWTPSYLEFYTVFVEKGHRLKIINMTLLFVSTASLGGEKRSTWHLWAGCASLLFLFTSESHAFFCAWKQPSTPSKTCSVVSRGGGSLHGLVGKTVIIRFGIEWKERLWYHESADFRKAIWKNKAWKGQGFGMCHQFVQKNRFVPKMFFVRLRG